MSISWRLEKYFLLFLTSARQEGEWQTILQKSNEMQQQAVFISFHCNIPLHVSDAFCTHHQEYIKLQLQPPVQVMYLGDVIGKIRSMDTFYRLRHRDT
jgi:hypothetical protein